MTVKMNLRIIAKNLATDQEIGVLSKSILKQYDRTAAYPTAWELRSLLSQNESILSSSKIDN